MRCGLLLLPGSKALQLQSKPAPAARAVSHTLDDRGSYFAWRSADSTLRSARDENRTVRIFRLAPAPKLWHSIWSNTWRLSMGFSGDAAQFAALIERHLG